jgi:Zn-dependent peptidase ImmA (M78 family)
MDKAISSAIAKNSAQNILEANDLLILPVDIYSLAEKNNIIIEHMPYELAQKSIYGAITTKDDIVLILYTTTINNMGFQNFTIAHELGHYFLDGHLEQVVGEDGFHFSTSNYSCASKLEREADNFASGLLMPEKLCKKLIGSYPDGLEGIKKLSEKTISSLTAAAIRYIDLTTSTAAVVVSSQGKFEYSVPTRDIYKFGKFPQRGNRIPAESLTEKFSSIQNCCYAESEEMDADLSMWIGGNKEIPCVEQVVTLGRTGKVLTVFVCQSLEEDEEEDNDNPMDDDDNFNRRWGFTFNR